MKTFTNSLSKIVILAVVLLCVLTVNYLQAEWTGPTKSAPNANVAAPINIGTDAQDKLGLLSSKGFAVIDWKPSLYLIDTTPDHRSYRILVDNGLLTINQKSGNDIGSGNYAWPAALEMNSNSATFANRVQADKYCDRNGENCFFPGDIPEPDPTSYEPAFGGMYSKDGSSCSYPNPFHPGNACACPSGFSSTQIADGLTGSQKEIFFCSKQGSSGSVWLTKQQVQAVIAADLQKDTGENRDLNIYSDATQLTQTDTLDTACQLYASQNGYTSGRAIAKSTDNFKTPGNNIVIIHEKSSGKWRYINAGTGAPGSPTYETLNCDGGDRDSCTLIDVPAVTYNSYINGVRCSYIK